MVVLLFSEERIWMLFPAVRWMSWASTVLPLTAMSFLAIKGIVLINGFICFPVFYLKPL